MKPRILLFLFALLVGAHTYALDSEVCVAAAKKIDDRIATGNHPAPNVAIATQLRDGIIQSCSFLDGPTLNNMLQGLDQFLPGVGGVSVPAEKSAADRNAEREAQRADAAQRRAERDKRRATQRAREAAEQALVSAVLKKPSTGHLIKHQLVSRLDTMWGAAIVDWDLYNNGVRLLYETRPSREQTNLPEAARHFYVVENGADDSVKQFHVFETNFATTVTVGLIRDRDEIVLQWHKGRPQAPQSFESGLERWSISNGNMISRAPVPQMDGPRGRLAADNHFVLVTDNGDLLYARTWPLETGPTPKTGVVWLLASVDGEVRDKGLIVRDGESVSSSDWFRTADGGAGMVLDFRGEGENGINSQLKPEPQLFGRTEVRPVVASERRLHVVGKTTSDVKMPAFERRLMWLGLENVEQSVAISGESTRLMDEAEGKFRVRDSAVKLSVAGRNRTAVTPSGNGHAILLKNNHRDENFPPTQGLWIQEFSDATKRRDTYLKLDADHLRAQFNILIGNGAGELYVVGPSHVVLLDETRAISAYAEVNTNDDNRPQAAVASGENIWLFGRRSGGAQQQVWIDRVQF